MEKIIILLLVFSCGYGQKIEHIKQLDTIYVIFKEGKFQERKIYSSNYREYYMYLGETKDGDYLNFGKPDRKNSLTEKGNLNIDTRFEDKSFLKKHKKEIIGFDFFKKYGIYRSTYEAFEKCKAIYIIDCSESKKRNITLYRVFKSSSYTMGE